MPVIYSMNFRKEKAMKRIISNMNMFLLIAVILLAGGTSFAEDGKQYKVTITNITRGQVITPPVVISHEGSFELFELGAPAIPELAVLAEEGDSGPLLAYLDTLPDVFDYAAASGPLLPGTSVTLEINARGKSRYLSVAGMLASTNDAFFAVRNVRVPRHWGLDMTANAYDAGSEVNTEFCDYIPGPPCGNHVRNTEGAEGYVHIHAGIHGIGDLDPAVFDWRNPVAEIKIRRARSAE
jgi:hypothetical protein